MRAGAALLLPALAATAVMAQPATRPARPPPRASPPPAQAAPEPSGEPAPSRPVVMAVELQLLGGAVKPPDGLVDVRAGRPLSPREARRSLVRLYRTGKYADVVARTLDVPGGVRVVFELVAKRLITDVTVDGAQALSVATVVQASGLVKNESEYTEDGVRRAEDRIVGAYRRRGYDQIAAATEVVESDLGVAVAFRVYEGEPTRIQRVTVTGDPGLRLPDILHTSGLELGRVLDRRALAEGLERLRQALRSQRYFRAHVGDPEIELVPPQASLALPLDAGPRYRILFHQNHHIPDRVLRAVLAYDGTETLDRPLMSRMARRLTAYYQARGFHGARVRPREVFSEDGDSAILAFDVEEGPRLQVSALTFEGNKDLSTADLKELVREAVRRREPEVVGLRPDDSLQLEGRMEKASTLEVPPLEPERVYSEDAYREAADDITALYRDRGFLSARARISEADLDLALGLARVRFTIVEGPRTTVSSLDVVGLPPGVDVPAPALPLRPGAPLSVSALERGRQEISRRVGHAGYLFAEVKPAEHLSPDGTTADIVYTVDPGPQVRLGQISLEGARRSDPGVVLANVGLRPGDVLDPERLLAGQRALVNLGGYRQVSLRLDEPEKVEPQKDLRVDLAERPFNEGEIGVGYSAVDGPRLLVDFSYPNVLGQAVNLQARGKVHWIGAYQWFAGGFGLRNDDRRDFTQPSAWYGIGGKAAVSVRAPRVRSFLPASVGARADLIIEREFRPSFQFASVAGIAGLDWLATSFLTASIQYNLELDNVCTYQLRGEPFDCGSGGLADLLTDQERRFFSFGTFLLQAVAPALSIDLRDDPANPTRGLVINGSGEFTSSLLERYSLFGVKAQGNITAYVPLGPRAVLAASLRGGRFFPLTRGQAPLPATKRFYMGGFTTLRGFREDGVLPADRRADLSVDRTSCGSLVNPAGCTKAALALLGGVQIPSEGGELYTLGKLELRLPFLGAMDLGMFFELGNLWGDPSGYDPLELRPVAGGGLRYETPIGPLALDVGFNLAPDPAVNEQSFNFHFNIGLF